MGSGRCLLVVFTLLLSTHIASRPPNVIFGITVPFVKPATLVQLGKPKLKDNS